MQSAQAKGDKPLEDLGPLVYEAKGAILEARAPLKGAVVQPCLRHGKMPWRSLRHCGISKKTKTKTKTNKTKNKKQDSP
jgi:hypothetical protein